MFQFIYFLRTNKYNFLFKNNLVTSKNKNKLKIFRECFILVKGRFSLIIFLCIIEQESIGYDTYK